LNQLCRLMKEKDQAYHVARFFMSTDTFPALPVLLTEDLRPPHQAGVELVPAEAGVASAIVGTEGLEHLHCDCRFRRVAVRSQLGDAEGSPHIFCRNSTSRGEFWVGPVCLSAHEHIDDRRARV
jgi:hypothetical protein